MSNNIYPFPDGDNDKLKQELNIELREYTKEQKDAAAQAWEEFCRNPVDATMFIKLIAMCDRSVTEATVLWDLLKFHRTTGNKLMGWQKASAQSYIDKYGRDFGTVSSYHRALRDLEERCLIVVVPVLGGNKGFEKQFRLDWIALVQQLVVISEKLPGLTKPSGSST